MMIHSLEPAKAFGALLRDNAVAAQYYDNCAWEQKQAILLQLHAIRPEDMRAFVDNLPHSSLSR